MEGQIPEGYEWPRFEAGELVKCGDRYMHMDVERTAWHIVFDSSGEAAIVGVDGSRHSLDKGERVKRPPVLAADGVPLEVGQTVWVAENGNRFHVVRLCDDGLVQGTLNGDLMKYLKPEQLTHQRPVLDADGLPIKVGDTVWDVETGRKFEVSKVDGCVVTMSNGGYYSNAFPRYCPSKLTHTKPEPDTWDSVWMDVSNGCETPQGMERRCKALAERERGE